MKAREMEWTEGPLVKWKDANSVQFTYLGSHGAEHFEEAVTAGGEVIAVRGKLHDREKDYSFPRKFTPPDGRCQGVEKVLLLGDLHGQYPKLLRFLQNQGVINKKEDWCWGKGHLVMCGDILDRGLQVLPSLWLLLKLEQQAKVAGGAVHVLLGNHELMVMQEDYRYVHPRLLQLYRQATLPYAAAFAPDTVLGQWLRSRNSVLVLNELLVAHGGISPAVAAKNLSIESINQRVREALMPPVSRGEVEHLLVGDKGPLWFRGYVINHPAYLPAGEAAADLVLEQYGAASMVVAHTTVPYIKPLLGKKVWAIDLDIEDEQVPVSGLFFEQGNKFFVWKTDGSRDRLN